MAKKESNKPVFRFSGSKDGGRRMGKGEQSAMIKLFGIANMLMDIREDGYLMDRIKKIPRAVQRLNTAETLVAQVQNEVMDTVPEDQALHLGRQLYGTAFLTYVGNRPVISKISDQGRWMSFDELNTVALCCRETCRICVADTNTQKQCPARKLLDKLPIDRPDTGGGVCGWFGVLE